MKCNICSNNIAENITFCPYCGSAIKRQEENVVPTNDSNKNINQSMEITNENQEVDVKLNTVDSQNNMVNSQEIIGETKQNINEQAINNNLNYNNMNNIQNYQAFDNQAGYGYNSINNNMPNYNYNNVQTEDKTNVWLAILSWFIPLVGIILFFTMKNSSKKTSKACGIVALISILLSSAILVFGFFSFTNMINEALDNNVSEEYDDYDDNDNSNITESNIWESYKVTINGKEIKLPCSYNEFVTATNFKIKTDMENHTLNNNYYDIINVYKDDKLAGIINLYNKTGTDILYKNTNVSRISQSNYNVETNKVDKIIFPGDLYAGKNITKEEVIKLLGKPIKEDVSEYNNVKTYKLKYTTKERYTTSGYYEITIIGDSINEIVLDNRP